MRKLGFGEIKEQIHGLRARSNLDLGDLEDYKTFYCPLTLWISGSGENSPFTQRARETSVPKSSLKGLDIQFSCAAVMCRRGYGSPGTWAMFPRNRDWDGDWWKDSGGGGEGTKRRCGWCSQLIASTSCQACRRPLRTATPAPAQPLQWQHHVEQRQAILTEPCPQACREESRAMSWFCLQPATKFWVAFFAVIDC